ncbi:cation-translocating P-type ATPase [Thermus sediminis]|uniref:cation-translocating P-type ATPase n=1 Tax=Thermus sediminis TaxID=1761908 RepID=UPI000E3C713B|nr:cation-transporting P-type ATPase [Thermus sediminis]
MGYKTPHRITAEEVLQELETTPLGLSEAEAQRRLQVYGPNELEEKKESLWALFARQFTNPLIVILIVAGFLALFLGDWYDTLVVWGLVLLNGILGFWQELRAQASIEGLKALTRQRVRVLREGVEKEVDASLLVPGDVILLEEGDVVPADTRLLEATGLMVDEAILTGESVPVEKHAHAVLEDDTPIYERVNCAYKGTVVARGKARGVVFATGGNTQMGLLVSKLETKAPQSPLTLALSDLARKWVLVISLILTSLVLVGLVQGREWQSLVFLAVAQLVSAVPHGLPIVITLTLVIGGIFLARNKVLVRHLPAVETLGSATFICSDKTGTITEGRLQVAGHHALEEEALYLCAALANDADGEKGDAIDLALLRWLEGEGISWVEYREAYERTWEYPFDTTKRLMAVAVRNGPHHDVYVKGAFESLLKMAEGAPAELQRIHDSLAEQGLRVLAFGKGTASSPPQSIEAVRIRIVGLVGFLDPPKEGVREAVRKAKGAGIRVLMITGDNLLTAKAVARMVGLYEEGDTVLEGRELAQYTDEELYPLLKKASVVARALPEDKHRIVRVLQSKGEIVAVTGDGVNDAPALRAADLGVAMGSGAQVSKDASAMIITDNNLAVIVQAIMAGRQITTNIAKVMRYLFSTNIFEVLYISSSILAGRPLPLYPTHILWINLVTDGVLDKAYPFTRHEGDPMKEKPRRPREVFTGRRQLGFIFFNGGFMAAAHFVLFGHLLETYDYETAITISFASAAISQWAVGLQEVGLRPILLNPLAYLRLNPYIYIGLALGIVLQGLALFVLTDFFRLVPLGWEELRLAFVVPLLTFVALELRKWVLYLSRRE